ncbi:hypothetical protein BDN72DRAFT_834869 [Pluteus cervinus]|uniref:Uncharacterized protein n=1 Tax=Pluteus cervinus TaxID=181527 RepID=A0ACD3B4F0_9AGAR|nr:hypothetical protein BDN72DRAFT_834869 [Pluteus cervinus]
MRHVGSSNATPIHVRRFLIALLGVALSAEQMHAQPEGTLTLWFHENKDENGNLSNKESPTATPCTRT